MGAPVSSAKLETARSALESACEEVTDAGEHDAVDAVAPSMVARPASTEQVADVMRAAAAHGLAVVPRGRGTKLSWGQPPTRVDLVVDLSRMSAVLEHAAGDLIVDTQSGATLAEVQRIVAGEGQRLAVDETVPGASVGGTLATATSGPGRVAVGTVRDLLIGVTVVRADGVVAKAGGRVVKNVAGYDLGKIVIGSFGTLAVITQAVFRLHPQPGARRIVTRDFDDADQAQHLVQQILHAQVVPAAVEVQWMSGKAGNLMVLLEGTEAGVEGRQATAMTMLGEGARSSETFPDWWGRYPWDDDEGHAGRAGARRTAIKVTFALSGLSQVLESARAAAGQARIPLNLRGSAGAGVLYGSIPADADVGGISDVVDKLRGVCTSLGGALVVLDAPPQVKAAVDTWGPVPAIDLMRRVKDQFDPEHRLAPGRFVGGI